MSDFESEMSAWKKRNGLSDLPDDANHEELLMATQEAKSNREANCVYCDKALPVPLLKLITRRIDPYIQIDEGSSDYIAVPNRVRACIECFKEKHENE